MVAVTPPLQIELPDKIKGDDELRVYFDNLNRMLLQLWKRTGGNRDLVADNPLANSNEPEILALKAEIRALSDELRDIVEDSRPNLLGEVYSRLIGLETAIETVRHDTAFTEDENIFHENQTISKDDGTSALVLDAADSTTARINFQEAGDPRWHIDKTATDNFVINGFNDLGAATQVVGINRVDYTFQIYEGASVTGGLSVSANIQTTGGNFVGDGAVPNGGSAGQVLKKVSGTDFDYQWDADSTGGGVGATDLGWTEATKTVTSSTGTNAILTNVAMQDLDNSFTATQTITQGVLSLGVDDTTQGTANLYGGATGVGGTLNLYTSADVDATTNVWVVRADELAQFEVNNNNLGTVLSFNNTTGDAAFVGAVEAQGGTILAGVDDTTRGTVTVYGAATTDGGRVDVYNSADNDTEVNLWRSMAESGDYVIRTAGGTGGVRDAVRIDDTSLSATFSGNVNLDGANLTEANEVRFGDGTTLHTKFVTADTTKLVLRSFDAATTRLTFQDSGFVEKGSLYSTDAHFGLLNSAGSWVLQNPLGTQDITAFGDITVQNSTPWLYFQPTADTQSGRISFDNTAGTEKGRIAYDYTSNALSFATNTVATALTLDSSQNATFAGNTLIGDGNRYYMGDGNDAYIQHTGAIFQLVNNTGATYLDAGTTLNFRTNGTAAALTLDSSQNAAFAGDATVSGGVISAGVSDNTQGILNLYGSTTGVGGEARFYTSADVDTTTDVWVARTDELAQFEINNSNLGTVLSFSNTTGDASFLGTIEAKDGTLLLGQADTTRGTVSVFGDATTNGGRVDLYNGADVGNTVPYFRLLADNDVLRVKSQTTDMMTFDGVANTVEFTGTTATSLVAKGGIEINRVGTTSALRLNASASGEAGRVNFLTNGSPRWQIDKNNEAESGTNAGSNFVINRYSDAGSSLGSALTINRASGAVSVANQLRVDDTLRIAGGNAPSSATDTGEAGEIRWDSGFIYVCVAANTWKRTAISTW